VVSEIVEAEGSVELGRGDGILERPPDADHRPHPALVWAREPCQGVVDHLPHGDLAALAALGNFEADHAPAHVHPIPRETKQLAPPHARLHGDHDDGQQGLVAGLAARLQQPGLVVRLQPADAALRLLLQPDPRHRLQYLPLVVGHAEQGA